MAAADQVRVGPGERLGPRLGDPAGMAAVAGSAQWWQVEVFWGSLQVSATIAMSATASSVRIGPHLVWSANYPLRKPRVACPRRSNTSRKLIRPDEFME